MKDHKILITGGAGFIGSNLARELYKENEVTIIDNLSTGHIENIQDLIDDGVRFLNASITDLDVLRKIFRNIHYVFHEAAIPSVIRSVNDPLSSNNANCTGTLNVLIAAKENKVKKVIYASSSSIYGDTPTLPKKEDMNPNPLSPYAVSKLVGEYYCEVFRNIFGLSTVSLRYFNVYGPRQDPNGEYAAVIPRFLIQAIQNKSLSIFGDGTQTRDFTFISDVVNANILAVKQNVNGIFNIAGGIRTSINELAKMILQLTGKTVDIVYDNPRPGDIEHSLADISKAKNKIGYTPSYNFERGLRETIRWYLNNK